MPHIARDAYRRGLLSLTLSVALVALPGFAQAAKKPAPARAPSLVPFTDVHTHLEAVNPGESVAAALKMMPAENASRIVFLPPPFTSDDPARYDVELLLPAIKGHEDRLAVLGGGGTLNPLLQDAVQSGKVDPDAQKRFREIAEQLLRDGAAGFGELAIEHLQEATPHQSAPADHPLLLLLADIAAEHGVPIDVHMEAAPRATSVRSGSQPKAALPANIARFERLLAHNPRARVVWSHAGWDRTGFRTPALCRKLLQQHPNLYMALSIDPARPGRNSPLVKGRKAVLDPRWLRLFQEFPDRFVIGSDQRYPAGAGRQRWETTALLLERLPPDLRLKLASENAARLFTRHVTAGR